MQSLLVFDASDLQIIDGVHFGDTLSFANDLILDDVYILSPEASLKPLVFDISGNFLKISKDSLIGKSPHRLYVDCCITLMSQTGHTVDAIILVEVDKNGLAAGIYLQPLAIFRPKTKYTLIEIDKTNAETVFSQSATVSFAKGTRMSLFSGEQKPIETLKVGDKLLTQDAGIQEIRWIGQSTVRATGPQAPVLIKAGVLQNENDLILSPDHRIYIYQTSNLAVGEKPEALVRVRHLIDGKSVVWYDLGYIDYYQLLFDEHQIIYAEGIAAESLLFDDRIQVFFRNNGPKGLRQHKTVYTSAMEISPAHSDLKSSKTLLQKVMQHRKPTL